MTPAEIICAFMEPRPVLMLHHFWYSPGPCSAGWWIKVQDTRLTLPVELTLDLLHKVEARLTKDQWSEYESELMQDRQVVDYFEAAVHATAAQKIKALAKVLSRKEDRS